MYYDSQSSGRGQRGGGAGRTRGGASRGCGRGRGGGSSNNGGAGQRDSGWGGGGGGGSSHSAGNINFMTDPNGHLCCGYLPSPSTSSTTPCDYRTSSPVALILHRADRHLILPPGGRAELERLDPMLVEERQEAQRKARFKKRSRDDGEDDEEGLPAVIPGLNVSLSSPALLDLWVQERKKRWPTSSVVEKRMQQEEDSRGRGEVGRRATDAKSNAAPIRAASERPAKKSTSSSRPSSKSEEDDSEEQEHSGAEAGTKQAQELPYVPPPDISDSDSDMDLERDAISSKAPAALDAAHAEVAIAPASSQVCRFFQQGRCNFGSLCKQAHELTAVAAKNAPSVTSRAPPTRLTRPRPKAPLRNPFDVPSLEMSLLRAEIDQHVSATAQCIRFLRRNGWLDNVALDVTGTPVEAGLKIEVLKEERVDDGVETTEEIGLAEEAVEAPLLEGALPSVQSSTAHGSRSLLEATDNKLSLACPSQLKYPPEPSLFLYLDPLRATEPKPLLRIQLLALSTDTPLRRLLNGYTLDSFAYTHAMEASRRQTALRGALEGIDDLPSEAHRRAALEYILGVSPHQPGRPGAANHNRPTPLPPPGERRGRVITERELLGLGLRIGPDEAAAVRDLASRVSAAVLVPFSDLCPDPDSEVQTAPPHLPKDFVPPLPLPPQKAVPEFEAKGWGRLESDRERQKEREEIWRKLGLELAG